MIAAEIFSGIASFVLGAETQRRREQESAGREETACGSRRAMFRDEPR